MEENNMPMGEEEVVATPAVEGEEAAPVVEDEAGADAAI